MKNLHFTPEQVTQILEEIAIQENGLQDLLRMSIEAMMRAEREEYNSITGDMSNGFRPRRTFGRGKVLELRVPRSRKGHFYPMILGLLRDEEEECRKLAFNLYGAGLTTEQVGHIFGDIYGKQYSTSQISRMFNYARDDVQSWLHRPLEPYYPILMIDATFISTRRVDHVSKEGYYTILGVRADRSREVISIVNFPTESASAWETMLSSLKERGVKEIGLIVCDSLTAIEESIWKQFPGAEVQLCTIHLQRNVNKHIKPKDKALVAEDLKDVLRTGDRYDTPSDGWQRWQLFCKKWGKYYPSIKKMGENERYKLHFTYLGYDYRTHNMLYSTNWIERLNRDYKRTTRMRGALPDPTATILLLGYVAMTRSAYQRKIPKIDYEQKKFRWEE
ncbi:MAG: IS256 family transposase [Bacteroidales bacterium]|nr:IS256 family transposase [Bacteroidales bacterium]